MPPVILFLGDSYTECYRLPAAHAFPAFVQEQLTAADKSYRVINGGLAGDTTAGALRRLRNYLRQESELAALVVELGWNDEINQVPLADTRENLRQIIRLSREHSPDLKVFLFLMEALGARDRRYTTDFAAMYVDLAREENVELLPFFMREVLGNPELRQPDEVHPNVRGMQKVNAAVWRSLEGSL